MITIWIKLDGRTQSIECSTLEAAKLVWDGLARQAEAMEGRLVIMSARP